MEELPEWKTRLEKIDVQLEKVGWVVKDKSKVLVEVDTKQSDFKSRNYKVVSDTLKNDLESRYADYLLDFNEHNKQTLSKDISVDFLKKMKQSIEEAIEEREKTNENLGDKSVIPADVLDYEVGE